MVIYCGLKTVLIFLLLRRLAARAPFVFYIFVWLVAVLVALPYFFAVSAEEVDNLEPWNSRKIDELVSFYKYCFL